MKRKASGVKPKEIIDSREIIYSNEQWELLQKIRQQAEELVSGLMKNGIRSILYGSVCRGDVTENSDIDLFIPYKISSFKIELALNELNENIYAKKIVQATPKHLVKGMIFLNELISISFPLTSIRTREFEFIKFGGSLSAEELKENKRVPGVDKRLVLIEPTVKGHIESSIYGFESIVAKKIGVSVELVKERIRILTTRDKVGRTGVYLDMNLAHDELFEEVFKNLKDNDPIIRRRSKL